MHMYMHMHMCIHGPNQIPDAFLAEFERTFADNNHTYLGVTASCQPSDPGTGMMRADPDDAARGLSRLPSKAQPAKH